VMSSRAATAWSAVSSSRDLGNRRATARPPG
jgi:hypothetical protein